MSLPTIETDTQISQQLNKIQGQLSILERKMDSLLSRMASLTSAPNSVAVKTPAPVYSQPTQIHQAVKQNNNQPHGRQLYSVICADCKVSCQIPFKPTGDRPVYCKDCFARRKNPVKAEARVQPKPVASEPISMAKEALSVSQNKKAIKSKKKPVVTKTKPAAKAAKKKIVKKSSRK